MQHKITLTVDGPNRKEALQWLERTLGQAVLAQSNTTLTPEYRADYIAEMNAHIEAIQSVSNQVTDEWASLEAADSLLATFAKHPVLSQLVPTPKTPC